MKLNINLTGAAPNISSMKDLGRIVSGIVFIYGTSTPAAAKSQLDILTRELRQLSNKPEFVEFLDALADGIRELETAQKEADRM